MTNHDAAVGDLTDGPSLLPPLGSSLVWRDMADDDFGEQEEPEMLGIFYRRRINATIAAPGSGKSMKAAAAVAEQASAQRLSIYLDAEDVTRTLKRRLSGLGIDGATRGEYVHYLNVGGPLSDGDLAYLLAMVEAFPETLVVFDSLPEMLTATGLDETSSVEVTGWFRRVARPLANAGACVLLIDHPVKSGNGNGYARGSGAKLAAVDGAVIELEEVQPFSPDQSGSSNLIVRKDRLGGLRTPKGQSAGTVYFNVLGGTVHSVTVRRSAGTAHGDPHPGPAYLPRTATDEVPF